MTYTKCKQTWRHELLHTWDARKDTQDSDEQEITKIRE